jgi:hypothetical protein
MPRVRGACLALVCAVLLAGSTVAADPLEKAKTALDNSDYFTARSSLDEALRAGGNRPDQLAEIYRLTGVVAGSLNDAKASKEAFEKCLALAPQTTLPAGTSPKVAKPFAAAQESFKGKQPLQIKTATANEPPSVTIDVVADPLKMIAKLQAVVVVDGKAEQALDKPVADHVTIDLPKGKRLDVRVMALDDKGNHLVEVGSKEVPIVIVGKAEPIVGTPLPPTKKKATPKPYNPRPWYWRHWFWGGAAVAFLGAGSYFGIDSIRTRNKIEEQNDKSPNFTFDDADDLRAHGNRSVLFTNIGLGVGGAFAITATVLYLTRPRRPTDERKPVAVAPMVHSSGGGLVLGGHF